MKNPATIVVRSEFKKGTSKVFKNCEEKTILKQLSDRQRIIESARATFFDIDGIENLALPA